MRVLIPCCHHSVLSSRGEIEGADSDRQGPPWQTRQGVQPHQPGAESSGQETEEGKEERRLSPFKCHRMQHVVKTWDP